MRVAVLTVSDGVSRGQRQDASGDAIAAWVAEQDGVVADRKVVADEAPAIRAALSDWADSGAADVVLTTGGTGLTARDVTPEATAAVLERVAPGLAEALRSAGAASTPYAWLSRGVAGTRRRTLIVNLPGSTAGVRDGLRVLAPLLPHAVQLIRGQDTRHQDG
ncbi:MAG TPA: MogA/MoaB family molybdenum cofactor biosynthesis protein [Longimicrobiales bacterium]|nr:MogA/MoaB family molybdenum cofactor biosynthesis protein [Longimicrobiales bacterium]